MITLASPRCCLQVLARAYVGRPMPRHDVGEVLRLGQWGRACQGPANACRACFALFCISRLSNNVYLKQFEGGGAPEIEAASPCMQAGRARLAGGATELVDLPPSLSLGRVFTVLTVPYRLPYRLDGQNSQRRRGFTSLLHMHARLPAGAPLRPPCTITSSGLLVDWHSWGRAQADQGKHVWALCAARADYIGPYLCAQVSFRLPDSHNWIPVLRLLPSCVCVHCGDAAPVAVDHRSCEPFDTELEACEQGQSWVVVGLPDLNAFKYAQARSLHIF